MRPVTRGYLYARHYAVTRGYDFMTTITLTTSPASTLSRYRLIANLLRAHPIGCTITRGNETATITRV